MVNISSNFSSSKLVTNCICGEQESMQHIYNTCKMLTIDENSLPYEKIYFGEVNEQIEILQKLEENLKRRDTILNLNNEPCDPSKISFLSFLTFYSQLQIVQYPCFDVLAGPR
jgi:hypothetical protein